jgi:hypothetical protein
LIRAALDFSDVSENDFREPNVIFVAWITIIRARVPENVDDEAAASSMCMGDLFGEQP